MMDPIICSIEKEKVTEVIKRANLTWHPAQGTNKWFQPLSALNSTTSTCVSKPHKVKGFADDLTIISSSAEKHTKALKEISKACMVLILP